MPHKTIAMNCVGFISSNDVWQEIKIKNPDSIYVALHMDNNALNRLQHYYTHVSNIYLDIALT